MAIVRATHASALLIIAAFVLSAGARLRAGELSGSPDVPTWIALLSSDDYDVRWEAAAKLAAQGDAARPALQQALSSSDVETRSIAARLLMQQAKSGLRLMAFDRNGKPCDGIEGTLQMWDTSDRFQRTRSNPAMVFGPNGIAEVDDIRPGSKSFNFTWQKCWVTGSEAYGSNSYFNSVTKIRAGRTPILFSFSKGGSIKGSIVDMDGKPVNDAEFAVYAVGNFNADMLDVHGEYQSMQPLASARTDAKGDALIENIGDGVYTCVATVHASSFIGSTIRVREGQKTLAAPISVTVAKPGKFVFAPRGIIDERNSEEIKSAREQWNQNNGGNRPEKKPDETARKAPAAPPAAEPLKDLKMAIDEDFLYEGPNAEKKQRALLEEKARTGRYQEKQQYDADESGKVSLDNLRAGKHAVTIRCPGFAPRKLTIDVPPGGVADLGELTLDAGGAAAFRATDSAGKDLSDIVAYPVPDDETAALASVPGEVLGFIRGQNTWDEARNYVDWQRQMLRRFDMRTQAKPKDKFTLNNLAPGKYSLLVYRQSAARVQQVYLICGVTIEMGKTTELPALSFPAPAVPERNSDTARIKGKLIGVTGDLSQRCTIYYQTQNGSTGSSTNTDGTFQLHVGNMGFGGTLRVKVPGYKLVEFDCSSPGLDLGNIEIKLEKQTYGVVRVRVVDEQGRPMAGAEVDPTPPANQNYYYSNNRGLKSLRKTTDAKGEALFTGLNIGQRRVLVSRDGYYISDPVRVTIQKDTEALIVVMLRKGLEISGKVSGPAGTHFENAVIHVRQQQDSLTLSVSPNAEGQYTIGGLSPDTYTITAEAPMLALAEPQKVELIGESKRDQNLTLVATGGFAAQLPPAFVGRYALIEKESPEKKLDTMYINPRGGYGSSGSIDASGLAEFWGIKAGRYKMSLAPNYRHTVAEKDGEKYASHIDCTPFSDPFDITDPKKFADLKLDSATKISFPEGSASALVKFVFPSTSADNVSRMSQIQSSTVIEIKGDNCYGQTYLNARSRSNVSMTNTAKLRIIGKVPAYLEPKKSTSGLTLIQGLVPGKCKILVTSITFNPVLGTQERSDEIVAAEFEIKPGEFKDLGVVTIEPSKSVARKIATRRQNFNGMDRAGDDDLDPAFEP